MMRRVTLARAIKRAGMTRAKVAEKLGVDATAVSRWCNGDREPKVTTAFKIARILKLTLDQIDWS